MTSPFLCAPVRSLADARNDRLQDATHCLRHAAAAVELARKYPLAERHHLATALHFLTQAQEAMKP